MLGPILGAIIGYGVAQGGWRQAPFRVERPPVRIVRPLLPPMPERIFRTRDIGFGTPFFGPIAAGGGGLIGAPIVPSTAAPPMTFAPSLTAISPGIVLTPFVSSVSSTVQPSSFLQPISPGIILPAREVPLPPRMMLPLTPFDPIPSAPEVILKSSAIATVPLTLESILTPVVLAPSAPKFMIQPTSISTG